MTSNSTTIDPLSIFTFKEAVNYFKGDDNCAFYNTLCDGKPCYKDSKSQCQTNSDCLGGTCSKDFYCEGSTIYYSGTFDLEDCSNYVKQYITQCHDKKCPEKKSGVCKGQTDSCMENFFCKDPSTCAVYPCGNIREGLPYGEIMDEDLSSSDIISKCRTDNDCLSGICSYGKCENISLAYVDVDLNHSRYGMAKGSSKILTICVIIAIIAVLALCCCCCCKRKRNRKN
ncbi:hypothetical protein BCR32DRAFT_245374 [Anaeromyces robustus]|uniref:Uncharacterized protein n=1 Tax=Anaeromyces robustus TaxID=1754192 RepID=A0A1Y1X5Z9_9FUNG|nr:hypothetical protein BCR32DRAFT_245374 [Anaeromyces robustus]|eukprot:ORX80796.1 hypothetical protein BCR32DRAFT_245374 [Anaeromyces robustus]